MQFRGIAQFAAVLALAGLWPVPAAAQSAEPAITFRSGVDLVSVSAVVRDKKGKVVRSLNPKDFEVLDGGQLRKIVSLQADETAPASIAFLVDGSGSMRVGTSLDSSRHICNWLLSTLDQKRDDASLLSFDTRLFTLREFTGSFEHVRNALNELDAFGATSITTPSPAHPPSWPSARETVGP